MPLFWTSDDVCPGFQRQGRSLDSPLVSTPADLLAASMVAESFLIHILACICTSIGGAGIRDRVCDRRATE